MLQWAFSSNQNYTRLAMAFYWNGMKHDMEQFVAACVVCKQTKFQALYRLAPTITKSQPCLVDFQGVKELIQPCLRIHLRAANEPTSPVTTMAQPGNPVAFVS